MVKVNSNLYLHKINKLEALADKQNKQLFLIKELNNNNNNNNNLKHNLKLDNVKLIILIQNNLVGPYFKINSKSLNSLNNSKLNKAL